MVLEKKRKMAYRELALGMSIKFAERERKREKTR
jgi:hypothetical protein